MDKFVGGLEENENRKRVKIAVVGTAGRGDKVALMTASVFNKMIESAIDTIENKWKIPWSRVDLVSGGAAWSDHVAVRLYMRYKEEGTNLTLYLPCPLDEIKNPIKFIDNGYYDWKKNPGKSTNKYHGQFSFKIGSNSIEEIKEASTMGAILNCDEIGFHARNKRIAISDYLLAFTWKKGDTPEIGGTSHTWDLCLGKRLHISLSTIE